MGIIQKRVSNYWSGRKGYNPEGVVIHIMDGTLAGTDAWFANASSQVSAHYGIGKSGEVHQYVSEEDSAWHAGKVDSPSWGLYKAGGVNPNLYTVGIEHEGKPDDVWTTAMIQASAMLIRDICQRWGIPIDRQHIIGHYQIYSKKPNCPATNKAIIDQLISLAAIPKTPAQTPLADGVKKIEEGLDIIKQNLN